MPCPRHCRLPILSSESFLPPQGSVYLSSLSSFWVLGSDNTNPHLCCLTLTLVLPTPSAPLPVLRLYHLIKPFYISISLCWDAQCGLFPWHDLDCHRDCMSQFAAIVLIHPCFPGILSNLAFVPDKIVLFLMINRKVIWSILLPINRLWKQNFMCLYIVGCFLHIFNEPLA